MSAYFLNIPKQNIFLRIVIQVEKNVCDKNIFCNDLKLCEKNSSENVNTYHYNEYTIKRFTLLSKIIVVSVKSFYRLDSSKQ